MTLGINEVAFVTVSIIIIVLALLSAWWADLFATRRLRRHIRVDHLMREYIAWLPVAYRNKGPLPVAFAFHAGFGRAGSFEKQAALHLAGEAANFIIVYPEGYKRSWNAGDCCGAAMREGIDDCKFVRSILDDLDSIVKIDRRRVYATGFSNGARLCYFLAGVMADTIAAIAPVSSAVLTGNIPARPVPVFHFHGLEDEWAPYRGGQSVRKNAPASAPVEKGLEFWRRVAGTSVERRADLFGNAAECIIYSGGYDGAKVQLCKIPGLGHHWPGGHMTDAYRRFDERFDLGPPGPPIFVNDAILKFLGSYALPQESANPLPPSRRPADAAPELGERLAGSGADPE